MMNIQETERFTWKEDGTCVLVKDTTLKADKYIIIKDAIDNKVTIIQANLTKEVY